MKKPTLRSVSIFAALLFAIAEVVIALGVCIFLASYIYEQIAK